MLVTRRQFITTILGGGVLLGVPGCRSRAFKGDADKNGILHSTQFNSRIVARSGTALSNGFVWPGAPDGAAVFPSAQGGWIYVCNSELKNAEGGVAALVFNQHGDIIDAYSILQGSELNCAGGATPWNTWLSCEEHNRGKVWQCDPEGKKPASICHGLGLFSHESVALDQDQQMLYLTEDEGDGAFYRYTPDRIMPGGEYDLQHGKLETCIWDESSAGVRWQTVPDPQARNTPTRYQKPCSEFAGGEGICYQQGFVYFNTKHDNRIWRYDTRRQRLQVWFQSGVGDELRAADCMTMTPDGSLWAGEDGDDLQVVLLTQERRQKVLLQLTGQPYSEITGVAFSPDYQRLYFNSQRGPDTLYNSAGHGISYELQGDFLSWAKT